MTAGTKITTTEKPGPLADMSYENVITMSRRRKTRVSLFVTLFSKFKFIVKAWPGSESLAGLPVTVKAAPALG